MIFKELEQVTPPDYIPYYNIDFYKYNTHKILKVDLKAWKLKQDKIVSWIEDNWEKVKEQTNEQG